MTRMPKVLRYVAFTVMALFGLLGGLFVAGEAFADPGGWQAVAMTAWWAVPLGALSILTVWRPAAAGSVLDLRPELAGPSLVIPPAGGPVPNVSARWPQGP